MDIQISNAQIPVNTRTVGKPSGIYILYLEDYVYTFIKKLLEEKTGLDNDAEYEISLFGKRFDEEGRSVLVISGAAQNPFSEEKGRQTFQNSTFLGNAKIEANKDGRLRLEVTIKNTSIVLDDFYIYYDQNDEMQNYLIEWNLSHKGPQDESGRLQPRQKNANVRAEADDAVRYGRLAQAYNREEARVSFIWNVMNILCLGLVLCIMVYGIISINNYQKMKGMEKTIDYCLALITDNIQLNSMQPVSSDAVDMGNGQYEHYTGQLPQEEQAVETQQTAETQQASASGTDISEQQSTQLQSAAEQQQLQADSTPQPSAQQPQADGTPQPSAQQQPQADDTPQSAAPQAAASETQDAMQALVQLSPEIPQEETQTPVPQYYIIQQGDTLRTISYDVYGTYNMVDEICKWNKIDNPDNILYGQRLLLP